MRVVFGRMPPFSSRQGVWIVLPVGSVSVEKVLLPVVEQLGHDNLSIDSPMNNIIVVFLRS